jgi:hypothetical protein
MSTNIAVISRHGYQVADINYGGLGDFNRLKFGEQEEVRGSLNYLEAISMIKSPPWGITLKLAQTYGDAINGPIQHNTCFVLSYCTHMGVTEFQAVKAVCTLNGVLRTPNSCVNAIAVSYKWYVALLKDEAGVSTKSSHMTSEYRAMDGKIFVGCISVQVAHAYAEYFNQFGLRMRVWDSHLIRSRELNCPCEAVPARNIMRDLPPSSTVGSLRTGSQVFEAINPDIDDPHWETSFNTQEINGWEPHFVLREDWSNKSLFYLTSSTLQKHMHHAHRTVNPETMKQERNQPWYTIKMDEDYEFRHHSNYGSSSRANSRG